MTFAESTDVSNCLKGQAPTPAPSGSNATPNTIGACYMHNDQLTNPFAFPHPVSELTKHVVATIPYEYYRDWGCSDHLHDPDLPKNSSGAPLDEGALCGRHGYKEFSSVIKGVSGEGSADLADKYFVVADVSAPRFDASGNRDEPAQKSGLCLLRTDDLGNPESWRAWSGSSFSVQMRSGYNGGDPDVNVCEPVAPGSPTPWSLSYNRYLKKYMVLGTGSGSRQ